MYFLRGTVSLSSSSLFVHLRSYLFKNYRIIIFNFFFIYINLIIAREIIPTITTTNKLLVMIADNTAGIDEIKFSQLIEGKWPRCWTNSSENHNVAIITIGTKLRNSSTGFDSLNFFKRMNGITRDKQVTNVHPIIVNRVKLKEDMFDDHSNQTSNECY